MPGYEEKPPDFNSLPRPARPVERPDSDHIVLLDNSPRMSGTTIVLIVCAAVAATALIVYLIVSNQRDSQDAQLARAQAAASPPAVAQVQPLTQPVPSQPQSQPVASPASPAPVPEAAAGSYVPNLDLEDTVNTRFLDDRQLGAFPIKARADKGVVTLIGSVPNENLRDRAEEVAASVKGVRRVINKIEIGP